MIPANATSALLATATLRATDDTREIFAGIATTISTADLLVNDTDSGGHFPLTIVAVSNPIGGTVSLSGGFITFTSTGAAGQPASFQYTVQNSIGIQRTATVNLTVLPLPPLVANADTFNVQQGSQVLISTASLIVNDTTSFPPITVQGVGGAYGGTASISGSNVTFTATAQTGQPAGFTYNIRDNVNNTAVGQVLMNITPLPPIDAFIFDSTAATEAFASTYVPPTMATIFNTWGRFAENNWFPSGTTPTGEAVSWSFNSSTGNILSTVNSTGHIGFVSPLGYDNYTHDCTVSSTDSDDDMIGIVIAFARVGTVNKTLVACRTGNGMNTWAPAGMPNWSIMLDPQITNNVGTVIASNVRPATSPPVMSWASSGFTRIRVQRVGDIIECFTTPFNSTTFDPLSRIVIDLSADSRLAWARGARSYGYSCLSQRNSTFRDVVFTGALDVNVIYNMETNQVLEFNSATGQWVPTGETVAQRLGFPRQVTNPETGFVYQIDFNGNITRIS